MTGGMAARKAFDDIPPPARRSAPSLLAVPAPDASGWKNGEIIDGKYEVLSIAGQGGMGVVYKIRHREWNLEMAVKTPLPKLVKDPSAKARFLREAQIWVDLGLHPNLVQCWFVRDLGGLPRVFVDYLSGGSLKDWISKGRVKPGDCARIIDLAAQACDGLAYAHERGVVHRDIKPGNMLMSDDGRLCITDFGLVKVSGLDDVPGSEVVQAPPQSPELTRAGLNLGTPQYGAPEQWGHANEVDARADIYALGVTLYELCCGRRPFDQPGKGEPAQVIIARHLASTPPDPRTFFPDIPEPLVRLALQCLSKNPADRPASMGEVRKRLERAHEEIFGMPLQRPVPEVAEARAAGLNNRAVSMWDLGQPEQALAAWKEALELDPHHAESIYNSSLIEMRHGLITDFDAEARLRETAKTQRKAQLYLSYICLETCDAATAQRALEDALADPSLRNDGVAWRALGHSLMAQEKFRDAESAFAEALRAIPGDEQSRKGSEMAMRLSRRVDGKLIYPEIGPRLSVQDRTGSVRSIFPTPDGRSIFTDNSLNGVSQFEIPSLKACGIFSDPDKQVLATAVSPDGKMLFCGGEDSRLHAWNLSSKLTDPNFYGKGHIGSIYSVAISPDSRSAVTAGSDKSVRLWELEKGTIIKTLWSHRECARDAVFSPNGQHVASCGDDATIRFWDFPSGERGPVIRGQAITPVRALQYASDGRSIFSAGSDGQVVQWDCSSLIPMREFVGHRGTVNAIALIPGYNDRFLVTCGDDNTIRIWDTSTGICLRTIQGHKGAVLTIALPPGLPLLVSGATENLGQPLRLWNLELDRFTRAPGEPDPYFAPLAICRVESQDKSQIANRRFRKCMQDADEAFSKEQYDLACTALKRARSVEGYERDPRALEFNARLAAHLPLKGVAAVYQRREIEGRHQHGIKSALFTSDGKNAFTIGRNDKAIDAWDLEAGVCSRKFFGHKLSVESIALVPFQALLISGSSDYSIGIWDIHSGVMKNVLNGHQGEINSVAVSRDGRLIASASSDATVKIWELSTSRCLKTFERDNAVEPFVAVKFAPDARHVFVGARDGYLAYYSLVTGRVVSEFVGHFGAIQDLLVFKDRPKLISAGEDKTLRAWNIDNGQNVWTARDGKTRFNALAFSPDQRFIFSGGLEQQDTHVRVWDSNTGEARGAFCPMAKGISALALSEDGLSMLTGTEEKYLTVWDLEWELTSIDPAVAMLAARASSPNLKRVSLSNASALFEIPKPKKVSIFLNKKDMKEGQS